MSLVLSVVVNTVKRELSDMQKKSILFLEGNTSVGH
jgi:hypothetical protein